MRGAWLRLSFELSSIKFPRGKPQTMHSLYRSVIHSFHSFYFTEQTKQYEDTCGESVP